MLTLHPLGIVGELGRNFKTTNMLESIMAQVEQRPGRSIGGGRAIRNSGGWRARCWTSSRGCAECVLPGAP